MPIGFIGEELPVSIPPGGPTTFNISLTVVGGGDVEITPAGPYPPATPPADPTEVTLTATWDMNTQEFIGWSEACDDRDATDSPTDPTCELTMDGNKMVTATFGPQQRTLTVNVIGGGGNRGVTPRAGVHVYDYDTVVQLEAHWDNSTHRFAWSGACSGSGTACAVRMTQARTVTATFTLRTGVDPQCTLMVDANPLPWAQSVSGDWTGNCSASTSRTATVVPHTGYIIDSWSEASCPDDPADPTGCTVTMDVDRDVTAYLRCDGMRTLTTSAGTGGTVEPATGEQPCDGTVTVTATPATTPAPGYRVGEWNGSGAGDCIDGQRTCDVEMGGVARAVSVDFVPQCTLVVNGGTGGATVDCGDRLTATATPPSASHVFRNWTGGSCGTSNPCTVPVGTTGGTPETVTVTANFETRKHTLTVAVFGGGVNRTVTPGAGSHEYLHGTTEVLRAAWDDTTHQFRWTGACSGTSSLCTVTMNGPRSVTGTFSPIGGPAQCTLQVDAVPSYWAESVTGDWTGACDAATLRTATVVPHAEVVISSWSESSCPDDPSDPTECTVTMNVDRDVTAYLRCDGMRTLTTSAGTGGTVEPATGEQPCDDTVTVTATPATTPAPGYRVGEWNGSGAGRCVDGQRACDVEMGGFARAVSVDFVPQCTLVVNGGTGGGTVDCGDRLTATATLPSASHVFRNWTGGSCGTSNPCTVPVGRTGGTPETVTVTANFTAPPPPSGMFTVTATGSSQSEVSTAIDAAAAARAARAAAVRYWYTSSSYDSETVTTGYAASGSYTWSLEATLHHDGVGPYDNAADAESAAVAAASAAIPSGATLISVSIYATESYPNPNTGQLEYWSGADATYRQTGSVSASGSGDDRPAAESAALAAAEAQAPTGATVSVVTVTTTENTSTTHTGTAYYNWEGDQDSDPATVTVNLTVMGTGRFNVVIWPGATAAIETATRGVPLDSVWYYDAGDREWYIYIPGAPPVVNSLAQLATGRHYFIRVTAAHTWRVSAATTSGRAEDSTAAAPPRESGWTARVTCDSGRSPVRLGIAATEAEAISAANWFINSPHGCGGAGTYTVSFRP